MRVGTIVRVPLHGRRVRGWIVEDDVTPEVARSELRPATAVVSAGPPADVVELCRWVAWRYAGPLALVLRSASPPNIVAATSPPELATEISPLAPLPTELEEVRQQAIATVAWPPTADRRELIAGLLADEGSTIVVVPDAFALSAIQKDLERTGRTAVVLRADTAAAERARAWDEARAGACVVLGARLATLAPVPDLAAVVVLDESDEALKEERAPTWNAREVGVERARRAGARVTLLSPAPSVEAGVIAGAAFRPSRGVEREGWPHVVVVDRRNAAPGRSLLSDELAQSARAALDRRGRVVCVLNRKGRARLLTCRACGNVVQCEVCAAAVVEGDDGLVCPRCGTERPNICLHCHATRFVGRRPGVTGMRDELQALLPRATVTEVTAAPSSAALAGDVLVGTESVLHQARAGDLGVELVAFLDFDQELLAPRYRAAEQALWLLVRAARLVGTWHGPGRVLIQTRVPEHEVVAAAQNGDPSLMTKAEEARRAMLHFPPFGGLAEMSGERDAVAAACELLGRVLRLSVSGPTVSGRSARALVQAPTAGDLADGLASADLGPARAHGRLRVEVDPLRV